MHAEILVIPLHPAFHSEISFKSHELGVGSDPSILSQKRVKIPAVFLPTPFSSNPEHRESPVKDRPVINMLRILSPAAGKDLLPGEKSVLHQKIKIYKVRITRKDRKALIGRVPIARGADRKDLPPALSGSVEEIHEIVCNLSQRTNAVRGRQRRDR